MSGTKNIPISSALQTVEEIKPLTSIRGIAVLLVMGYHFHQFELIPLPLLHAFMRHAYLSVDLFFILSGFVLGLTNGAQFIKTWTWDQYKIFMLRRIGRVYPVYLTVTLFVSLYSLAVYGDYNHSDAPAVHLEYPVLAHVTNFFLLQSWGFGDAISRISWTLSLEWGAYLLFPLLAWVTLSSRWWLAIVIGGMAFGMLSYAAYVPHPYPHEGQLDIWYIKDWHIILRCFGSFLLGLLTFQLTSQTLLGRFIYTDAACGFIILSLLAMMVTVKQDMVIYPFLLLIVASLYGNRGFVARLFSGRIVYWLGTISFPIYLWHEQFVEYYQFLQMHLQTYMAFGWSACSAAIIIYGAILGLSDITHRFIENPGRRWFKHLAKTSANYRQIMYTSDHVAALADTRPITILVQEAN